MRIGIITPLTTDKKAGIGVYTTQLVQYLKKIDHYNEYFIFVFSGNEYMFDFSQKNIKKIVINLGGKINKRNWFRLKYFFWHKYVLPHWTKKLNLDLIHIPSTWFVYSNSLLPKQVITIHDLTEFNSNRYGKVLSFIKRKMVYKSIKNADGILTVSFFSKNEINEIGNSDIFVVYNGFEKIKFIVSEEDQMKALRKFGLDKEKYFLFIGTMQKHKNIPNIIESFAIFEKKIKGYKLVLGGKKDNASSEIKRRINKNKLNDKVLLLDYVTEDIKRILIKNALAFVLVSDYEGFGLPILEAQELNTPVICSNTTSLPEIAGEGALKVNPNDVNDITSGMIKLINSEDLRSNLVKDGKANLNKYSWVNTAKNTLKVYEKLSEC